MVTVMGCKIVLLSLLASSLGSDEELYSTHLYSSYLQHNLPPSNSLEFGGPNTKREVKFSKSGLFYHDGPYVSHPQAERAASPLEIESYVTPLPETLHEEAQTPTTTPSPYTYSVTGRSVTPASHYHGSPTPSPYHGSPTPSPYHGSPDPYYGSPSTPVYYPPTTPNPYHTASYKYTPSPAHPVTTSSYPHPPVPTYPHPPIPTYAPNRTPYAYNPTPAPFHHSTPGPYPAHRPKPAKFSLVEDPLPPIHHPARAAQESPTAQPFLSPVHPTPFSFQPRPDPPQQTGLAISPRPAFGSTFQDTKLAISFQTPDTKPAITFQDYGETEKAEEYDDYQEEIIPEDFRPVFQQEPRGGKQLGQAVPAVPQPIFGGQTVLGFAGSQLVERPVQEQREEFQSRFPQLSVFAQPQPIEPASHAQQPSSGFQQFAAVNSFSPPPTAPPRTEAPTRSPRPRFAPRPTSDVRAMQFQPQQQQVQPQQQQFQPQQQQFQPQQQEQFQPQQQQEQFQPQQQQQFQPQQQQFQPQQQQQFQPQQQQFQPQPQQQFQSQQQQQFQPQQQQQFQPQQQQQFQPQQQQQLFEPQPEIDQTETLFSSINKAATDREPRRQLTNLSSMKHMSRNDALARLMDIAGSDWDLSHSIQENLVGGPEKSDYDCPASEGHFPDTKKCNVYYQCANGISTRHSCGAGLKYNVLTNQCDWAASVDCSLNSDPRMLNQHSGPTPRPQVPVNFQKPFTATQDNFQLQQQQFQPQGQQFQQEPQFQPQGQQFQQEQQFQPQEQQFQQQQQSFSKFFTL